MTGTDLRPPRDPAGLAPPGLRGLGFGAKLLLLGAVNAWRSFGAPADDRRESRLLDRFHASITTVVIDCVYLSTPGRTLPLKYLIPGTIFLLVFPVYPILYTVYISFTNFGTGNILSKDQAIERILEIRPSRPPTTPASIATPLRSSTASSSPSSPCYLVDEDGTRFLGTADGLDRTRCR